MAESGQTWQKAFKALPVQAFHVRRWAVGRVGHPDVPLVADELFVAILASGANTIQMTLSTAGERIRVTAEGPEPLSLLHSHGPGWRVIAGLADLVGLTTDEKGLWAQFGRTTYDFPPRARETARRPS